MTGNGGGCVGTAVTQSEVREPRGEAVSAYDISEDQEDREMAQLPRDDTELEGLAIGAEVTCFDRTPSAACCHGGKKPRKYLGCKRYNSR